MITRQDDRGIIRIDTYIQPTKGVMVRWEIDWKDGHFFGKKFSKFYEVKDLTWAQQIDLTERILETWTQDRDKIYSIRWQETLMMEFSL